MVIEETKKVIKRAVRKAVKKAVVEKPAVAKPRKKRVVPVEEVQPVNTTYAMTPQLEATVVAAVSLPKPDYTEAKAKYKLGDIDQMTYLPRDEFVQSLIGVLDGNHQIEDVIAREPEGKGIIKELQSLAKQYIVLRDQNARLPKFGKWVNSMFSSNIELQTAVAKAGQKVNTNKVVVSGDIVDLLRVADTTHYWSCLSADGMYKEVTRCIVERYSGIFIAYIDGPDGKMKGRVFLNHARHNGEDVVVAASHIYGNGFTYTQLADYFADLGVKLYVYQGYYNDNFNKGEEVLIKEFVNCFGADNIIHYDTPTWHALQCTHAKPSAALKKAA